METIYTVTTIEGDMMGTRCVGWFVKQRDAIGVVLDNLGDIYEFGEYPYAVIEAVPCGLYEHDPHGIWYKWDEDGYKEVEKPPEFDNEIGFAMG